jgi:hypothetical protein
MNDKHTVANEILLHGFSGEEVHDEDAAHISANEGWCHGLCEEKEVWAEKEMCFCELIKALLDDVFRLEQMVIETRKEVNFFSDDEPYYDDFEEYVFDDSYFDLPAMKLYKEFCENDDFFLQ